MTKSDAAIDPMKRLPFALWLSVVAANGEERQAMTWRPIETAPQDGADILVAFAPTHGWQRIVKWYPKKSGEQWVDAYTCKRIHEKPTHWMRLPPEPITVIECANPWDGSAWRCSTCGGHYDPDA